MELSTFQKCAERTMLPTQPPAEQMQNAALGLCGEAAELSELVGGVAPILDEAGDLLWYVAQMCRAFEFSIADVPPLDFAHEEKEAMYEIFLYAGKVADKVKKHVYHKKPMNLVDLARNLQRIVTAVDALLGFMGARLSDACDYNDRKLRARFPDGFSTTAANARADEAQL